MAIEVNDYELSQGLSSIESTQSRFNDFSCNIHSNISYALSQCENIRGECLRKIYLADERIRTVHNKLSTAQAKMSMLQSALASCRPPYYKTFYDSEGHAHTELVDPDGPKRAKLQGEISILSGKIATLQSALGPLEGAKNRLMGCRLEAERGIETLKGALSTLFSEERTISSKLDTLRAALNKAQNAFDEFNSVQISTYGSVSSLPTLSYSAGTVSISSGSSSFHQSISSSSPKTSTVVGSGGSREEITILLDEEIPNEEAFIELIHKIIEEHQNKIINLKIYKNLSNFSYHPLIKDIDLILKEEDFIVKTNMMGMKYTTVDGCYVYVRK